MSTAASVAPSLLIVDDNDALCQLLVWEFEDLEYAVWRAADCSLAVASARAMSFDCALIDYHLPDGDGHALSRELKRLLPAMRIVLMSADRTTATAEQKEATVTTAFVEKPVPPARIHRLFRTQIGRPRSRPCCAG